MSPASSQKPLPAQRNKAQSLPTDLGRSQHKNMLTTDLGSRRLCSANLRWSRRCVGEDSKVEGPNSWAVQAPTSERAVTVMSPTSSQKPLPARRNIAQSLPTDLGRSQHKNMLTTDLGSRRLCSANLRWSRRCVGEDSKVEGPKQLDSSGTDV
ncbi:hypothetical protein C8R43DRAFT_1027761 [Mycena crocata]|nr:hypothetical protein C8R43DRAFT_1027761 [Mycena crocata]